MKNILLIPDSFKGTMSSEQICTIMDRAIKRHFPEAKVTGIPVADGGEGSVDAFLQAVGGEKKFLTVQGPFGTPMEAFYGIIKGNTAVIEMAACAGLPLVGDDLQPDKTTTFGVGQLMLDAVKNGCKNIIVGLGGSATNDAGCGSAAACGIIFKDAQGKAFVPTGGTLAQVASIDLSKLDTRLKEVTITSMCDIDNPFHGKTGAAYIFAPQKGADMAMVQSLDTNMQALAKIIERDCGLDVQALGGSGAAGGMGGGMAAFFKSQLQMGIETVLETVGFDTLLEKADLVLTGEGKIDGQSLRGKVVIGVARRAKKANVPVIAVVGDIGDDVEGAYEEGVSAIFSINRLAVDFKIAKKRAQEDMEKTIDNLMRFIKRMGL
ncbi:glycerate kinase [uncultured Sphaerochaeta sp.]|uniref:glycerate kinase family protein n=1 Tax=uncultured Sphaerochaeta sp. TaxID=886478 RepID=UPI002A0A56B8|nr:glycerate kinase [uncultured Sphaerochaeta sp.]